MTANIDKALYSHPGICWRQLSQMVEIRASNIDKMQKYANNCNVLNIYLNKYKYLYNRLATRMVRLRTSCPQETPDAPEPFRGCRCRRCGTRILHHDDRDQRGCEY